MKKIINLFLISASVLLLGYTQSFASEAKELKISAVADFLNVETELRVVANKMRAEGLVSFLKPQPLNMLGAGIPSYLNNIKDLKAEHPAYYADITKIAAQYEKEKRKPFKNAEDWAVLGDRVMIAFFAGNSESAASGQAYKDVKDKFPVQVMAMLPPESKAQIQAMFDMLKSLEEVSEHDKLVVKQFKQQLVLLLADGYYEGDKAAYLGGVPALAKEGKKQK